MLEYKEKQVYLVSSGDLRLSANQNCWEAQADMERLLNAAIENQGWEIGINSTPYKSGKWKVDFNFN